MNPVLHSHDLTQVLEYTWALRLEKLTWPHGQHISSGVCGLGLVLIFGAAPQQCLANRNVINKVTDSTRGLP